MTRPEIRSPSRSLLAVTALASCLAFGATAESPPISLSNQHVGMSSEQIAQQSAPAPAAAAQPPAQPQQAQGPAQAPASASPEQDRLAAEAAQLEAVAAEKQRAAQALAQRAADTRRALAAAEAGLIPGIGPNQDGPATFESCIEATIRRGESFADSNGLCKIIYGR